MGLDDADSRVRGRNIARIKGDQPRNRVRLTRSLAPLVSSHDHNAHTETS
jgi:hypothetical protein